MSGPVAIPPPASGRSMRRAWAIAWRNLRRNRRRNLATAAAIAFGYAGLVVLGGYERRIEAFLRTNAVYLQHAGHVVVYLEGGLRGASAEPERMQLDAAAQRLVLDEAARDPRVEFGAPYLRAVGLAGNGCTTLAARILGVDPAALARIVRHPNVQAWSSEIATPVAGSWPGEVPGVARPAAVTAGLARLLGKRRVHAQAVGLPPAPRFLHCDGPERDEELAADASVQLAGITYEGTLNALDTEMVGTYHATESLAEDGSMLVPLSTLRELLGTDRATYVALFLRRHEEARAVAADLTRALAARGLRVEAVPFDDDRVSPYYVGTVAFLGSMVGFITTLVVLVLVLTVVGAMTLTILERARELGTWRALGFERGHLVGLVVREAFLLSLVGLGAGLGLGLLGAAMVNHAGVRFSPPGVPGTIALLVHPSARSCLLDAALLVPGVCLAAWRVARGQVRRGVVDLLTAQSG